MTSERRKSCWLLARTASERQLPSDGGQEVDAQLNRIRQYACDQGLEIVGETREPGASGNAQERPGLVSLIKAASTDPKPFDILLIESWSRLSTDLVVQRGIIQHLEQAGIEVRTADVSNPEREEVLIRNMLSSLNHYGGPPMRTDHRYSRLMRAQAGHWVDAAPFGYVSIRGTDNSRTLEIYEDEAKVVRRAFHLARDHNGPTAIARHLNEAGYKTRRGGEWLAATVKRMLSSRPYAGRARKKIPRWPGDRECITIRFFVPPIIPRELFLNVQCVRWRARRVCA